MTTPIYTLIVSNFKAFANKLERERTIAHHRIVNSYHHSQSKQQLDYNDFFNFFTSVRGLQIKANGQIRTVVDPQLISNFKILLDKYNQLKAKLPAAFSSEIDEVQHRTLEKQISEVNKQLAELKERIEHIIADQCRKLNISTQLQFYLATNLIKNKFNSAGFRLFKYNLEKSGYITTVEKQEIILERATNHSILMTVTGKVGDVYDTNSSTQNENNEFIYTKVVDAKETTTAILATTYRVATAPQQMINITIEAHKEEIFNEKLAALTQDYQKAAETSYAKPLSFLEKIKSFFSNLYPFGIKKENLRWKKVKPSQARKLNHKPSYNLTDSILGSNNITDPFLGTLIEKVNKALNNPVNYLDLINLFPTIKNLQTQLKKLDLFVRNLGQKQFNLLTQHICAISQYTADLNSEEEPIGVQDITKEANEILTILCGNVSIHLSINVNSEAIQRALTTKAKEKIFPVEKKAETTISPPLQKISDTSKSDSCSSSPQSNVQSPIATARSTLFTPLAASIQKTNKRNIASNTGPQILLATNKLNLLSTKITKALYPQFLTRAFKRLGTDYYQLFEIFIEIKKLSQDQMDSLSCLLTLKNKTKLLEKALLVYAAIPESDNLNDQFDNMIKELQKNALDTIKLLNPNHPIFQAGIEKNIIKNIDISEKQKKQIISAAYNLASNIEKPIHFISAIRSFTA